MPAGPAIEKRALPRLDEGTILDDEDPYMVILYNDDYHGMDEVVMQLQIATRYDIDTCIQIMWEAHTSGRAVAYTGSYDECERVANILRQIRLEVENVKF
jgi:ATP-dependent Clp protease adapter protein ClpS